MKPTDLDFNSVKDAVTSKGYVWFEGADKNYNLNIVGIRDNSGHITNEFDDVYTISWEFRGQKSFKAFPCTTDPGNYYSIIKLLDPRGVAILAEGQHRGAYMLGTHRGRYQALVQRRAVPAYRDKNRDKVLDMCPTTITTGLFGINHHAANFNSIAAEVNKHSAGCQVLQLIHHFRELIKLANMSRNRYGNSFTYTLLRSSDLK